MNDTLITIQGWVGGDVTVREVAEGVKVAQFRVATTPRRFRPQTQQWENGTTTWFTIKAWRRLADHVAESVRSGQPVLVHGRLVAEVWEKQDGSTQVDHVVVARSVGHDLSLGTSSFTRTTAPAREQVAEVPVGVEDPSAWQVPDDPAA